jgi:hypothetical protein
MLLLTVLPLAGAVMPTTGGVVSRLRKLADCAVGIKIMKAAIITNQDPTIVLRRYDDSQRFRTCAPLGCSLAYDVSALFIF